MAYSYLIVWYLEPRINFFKKLLNSSTPPSETQDDSAWGST
jgi:hypothetical protein